MGFNDFHKGFVKDNSIKPNASYSNKFGARSIDDIIKSRYLKRDEACKSREPSPRRNIDYQQNMKGQINLRNLDK